MASCCRIQIALLLSAQMLHVWVLLGGFWADWPWQLVSLTGALMHYEFATEQKTWADVPPHAARCQSELPKALIDFDSSRSDDEVIAFAEPALELYAMRAMPTGQWRQTNFAGTASVPKLLAM